ncbi:branched-chain amino acid ABC transporter permease [Roseovarius nanhaiticus]|uniref:branched-chain amino acid ABC transporter permease n=1 Tax=Roseovarius nanhaiticus TaxID=573024 RepID=UPI002491A14A|nr:branched-chain amino acid ABC transporter permease [Roseovarius nanhaiticus]
MSETASTPAKAARGTLLGWLICAALVIALIAAPYFFYPVFLMKLLCFALFASAFNLLLGYTGLLSFGHATFFGGAAYATAHSVKIWGFDPVLGILFGTAAAAVMGLLMGIIAIRRQGIYFAMSTLALSQMAYFLFLRAPFTNAEDGIQNVPRGYALGLLDLSDPMAMYGLTAVVFLFGMGIIWRVIHSPFGQVLLALRENETRAISLGYRADRYKLGAFVLSATLAGLAGATKALVFQIATLTDVAWQMSGEVILMSLLGGVGTFSGPTVGAILIVTIQNYTATSGFPVLVILGLLFIVCVLTFRSGIVGEIRKRLR